MARGFLLATMLMALIAFSPPSFGQTSPGSEPLALQGYDPVAYFVDGKALPGTEMYQLSWDGARYHFALPEYRDAFQREPDKYEPQFGGLCTMGLAKGMKKPADPRAWLIMNGKLYLFSSTNARERFLQDPSGYIAKIEQ